MFFYLMILNIYYWEKQTLSKLDEKVNFLERTKKYNVLKNKKIQRIFGKRFILALLSPAVFRLQTVSQISFKLFLKGLYQSFLENEVDFRDIMNASPNTLAKKLRHGFVDERALITRILISSCHWKTLVPCCLKKERPENVYWIVAKSYRRTNYDIQNNSKLAI